MGNFLKGSMVEGRFPGCETAEMANGGSVSRDDMVFNLMIFEAEMMSREYVGFVLS